MVSVACKCHRTVFYTRFQVCVWPELQDHLVGGSGAAVAGLIRYTPES
jgi:hypothetical protein